MSRKKNSNRKQEQGQAQKPKLIFTNILGENEEPVCDFLNCYHKFSLHGHRSHQTELNCMCNHPTNAAIGIVKK